jgi:carboxyl-terminal processing protease
MTISRFDEETGSLARAAAEDFKKQNVKGVILDLRDNGGGYVEAAKQVASIWLDNKIIVTERRGSTTTDTIRSGSNPILNGIPTVVLVNGNSASASEIVSGALQDYKVAKIVGQKTFGKGSVQKLVDLDGGAQLKVTIAKWYTPNGKNISKTGISPDVTADLTADDINNGVDPQMDASIKALGL